MQITPDTGENEIKPELLRYCVYEGIENCTATQKRLKLPCSPGNEP